MGRRALRACGYDLVYFAADNPGTFHRYPYANQGSFFEDLNGRGYVPKTVVDIGANHGSWSVDLANVFTDVTSILVEPQEELTDHLKALANRHAGWKVAPVGIAGEDGVRRFQACDDTVSSSFLKGDDDPEDGGDIRELQVVTLDRLVGDYADGQKIDIVKIDAEGLEAEILKSGPKTISNADIVMLEVAFFEFNKDQPKFSHLVSLMSDFGFSIYDFTMFYRRPHDGALGLMDCVFVSNTCSLRSSHAW